MEDTFEYKITPKQPKMKTIGTYKVPLGCYHDPYDQFNAFRQRLDDSIFKSLKEIEIGLLHHFSLEPDDVLYEVFIGSKWTLNVTLETIYELSIEYLRKFGDMGYSLEIVINCKKNINGNDVMIWGTVFHVGYWQQTWWDEVEELSFVQSFIHIEEITTSVDEPFTEEQIGEIKCKVINQLQTDYDYFYSKN